MSENEKAIEKAINNIKASFAVEGLYLSDSEERLIQKKVTDQLSDEEFLNKVKNLNTLE
ncbi:hypothetical protein IUK39_06965 [Priestia aryabhattai]|uniref:hypothetical protein n=1 Tax=Priestia aryabhattai TaxID=412384 RepID=UPI001C0AB99D|nr:hypothetical protein [Priestia aryabhattai]MBU3569912.1 hypothetical protein [Priestia aryabhattai]